jgi:hypothetical protein
MKKLAIISVYFDYPEWVNPVFEKRLLNDIKEEDYYILRYQSHEHDCQNESLYYKFTLFRLRKMIEFIENKILNQYEYFILLDATDVGYVGNISKIDDIMEYYKCNILFGAERNLWPSTDHSHLYDERIAPTPYRFINAGVFCAKPEPYLLHVKSIINRGLFGLCDQGNWHNEFLLNGDGIQIDYDTKLVLNTYISKEDFDIKDNEIIFKRNTPIFVHDNGGFNDETVKLLEFFV